MRTPFLAVLVILSLAGGVLRADAQTVAQIVSGKIVLDVERNGEAWYVNPTTSTRYYLRDGEAAYTALEAFGLGVTDADIAKIPIGLESRSTLSDRDNDDLPDAVEVSLGTDENDADSDNDGYSDAEEVQSGYNPLGSGKSSVDNGLVSRLEGRILLQVESHGEAWYVYPDESKRYYLGDGEAAYEAMRYLGLGISSANLQQVAIAGASSLPPDTTSAYQSYTLSTSAGSFAVRVAMLRRDAFTMVTDTAATADCDNCAAQSLEAYVQEHNAFAAIHGSYFCPPDYADCANKTYSFYPPAFNTALDVMMNDDTLIHHDRPMIARTSDGGLHYFHRGEDFGETLADYESSTGKTVTAAIGNWPSLVEGGASVVAGEPTEAAFSNKGTRGGIGWDDTYYYLVIASSATVSDLAAVFTALNVDYAMNLDGGGSSAMYYDGAYKIGPGRLLPNAILFKTN